MWDYKAKKVKNHNVLQLSSWIRKFNRFLIYCF